MSDDIHLNASIHINIESVDSKLGNIVRVTGSRGTVTIMILSMIDSLIGTLTSVDTDDSYQTNALDFRNSTP